MKQRKEGSSLSYRQQLGGKFSVALPILSVAVNYLMIAMVIKNESLMTLRWLVKKFYIT